MSNKKFHVRKGDQVKVLAGVNKGKVATVEKIIVDKDRAIISGEGVKQLTKHVKPTANNPKGSIEKLNPSVHISNLMLVEPKSGEATRVGRKLNDANKLQRFSKKSGEFIPEPK